MCGYVGNLYVLPVKSFGYLKILMANRTSKMNTDTILSPLNLHYDSLWKYTTDEIPAWTYSGTSQFDFLVQTNLFISYEYRIGDYEPLKFYTQTIKYELDTINQKLLTKKIYERKQK